MEFLTKTDLESQLFEDFIDDSTADEILVLDAVESQMIALVKSKLRQRYNVVEIFSKTAADRNQLIVQVLVMLVNYKIIRRNAARKVPSDIKEEWLWANKWLNDVRDGIEMPDLPVVTDTAHQEVYSGNTRNNNWFL